MEGKSILKQLSSYQQGKQTDEIKKEYNLEKIVKLSSNENPYGFSNDVKDKLTNLFNDLNIYPDGYTSNLREALRKKLHVNEDQLVFGAGSDELIQLLCRAFLYENTNTVMPVPTFSQYKHNALIEGATIKEIPLINGYHDLDSMLESIDSQTKIVWLCSPDNPTGTNIAKEKFSSFMEKCPENVLVVLDEAYYEFMDEETKIASLDYLNKYKNLILLRTFSKAYGLAGIRVGYGIAHEEIIQKLNVVRGPFNTTSISQEIATYAIHDDQFLNETVRKNKQVRESFQLFLDELGWDYYKTQTNFILVSTPISGTDFFQYLLEHGFIVRPGELLGFPNTVRITIGTAADMKELQQVITKFQSELIKE